MPGDVWDIRVMRGGRGTQRSPQSVPVAVEFVVAVTWAAVVALVLAETIREYPGKQSGLPIHTVAGVVCTGWLLLLGLVHLRRLAATKSRRAFEASAQSLERVIQITEVALSALAVDELLDEMAARVHKALGADFVTVMLAEGDQLVIRTAAGVQGVGLIGNRVSVGQGLAGRVAEQARSLTLSNLRTSDFAVPLIPEQFASAAGAPMIVAGKVIGVLVVASGAARKYDHVDVKLLELAADRIAGAIEGARLGEAEQRASLGAEHARRHLRFLGDASRIFMQSADDYEPPLKQVVDLALKEFASFGAVLLAEDSSDLRVLVARHVRADLDQRLTHDDWLPVNALEAIREVMASGHSRLIERQSPGVLHKSSASLDADVLGLTSYVIAPIRVRGLAFGAVVFGTASDMRGYRRSDQSAIDELTRRAALAVENSLLYREALVSAERSTSHLQRLRGLLDVWLTVSAAPDRARMLTLAVAGAARVLDAQQVTIIVERQEYTASGQPAHELSDAARDILEALDRQCGSGSAEATMLPAADLRALGGEWLAAPIRPATGPGGFIVVSDKSESFTAKDESLLGLLTQMLSACLANASLHTATHESEARLAALLEASPAAIIALSPEGVPEQWNPAAMALYDWSERGHETLPPVVAECVARLAAEVGAGAATGQDECRVLRNGVERLLVLMVAPITSHAGGISGHILVTTDDTARRALAEKFQQAQRLDVVERLAGGVAHDFNNLLTVILGYADGLLRRFEPDDPAHRRVAAIHRAGTTAAALTRELLTISRHQVLRPIVLDPAVFINEIAGMLERIVGTGVTVRLPATSQPFAVRIDRMQLEQVLLNLAANARDAMPEGGALIIDVVPVARRRARTDPGPAQVAITVADSGIGMDPETLAHCLEPFYTTKQPERGTGLGLAAVHGIISQSGGALRVESRPGFGTIVTVVLPIVSEAVDTPVEIVLPGPLDRVEAGAGTVLIVDDDLEVRGLVRSLLRERGYQTLVADSGDSALGLLAGHGGSLDLLLTDVALPGMSGGELARAIQLTSPVPVLFMSGFAKELGGDRLDDGFEASFLAKPFTPDELVRQVEAAIARTGQLQASKR
jgi:signal transduction histidine kinase/GAF domain-containing protein/ActR/RegA family two-component response regulator